MTLYVSNSSRKSDWCCFYYFVRNRLVAESSIYSNIFISFTGKFSICLWNIPEKSSKNCHLPNQIAVSRNYMIIVCTIVGTSRSCGSSIVLIQQDSYWGSQKVDKDIYLFLGLLREQETPLVRGKNWFLNQEILAGGFVRIQDSSQVWEERVDETRIITTEGLTTCLDPGRGWTITSGG